MKYIVSTVLLIVNTLSTLAQGNLSGSLKHSLYTYVYHIHQKEAARLVRTNLKKVDEKYLHSLVDSFVTGNDEPLLRQGNYLFVCARENKLLYKLHTIGDLDAKLISNDHDLSVAVHTRQGLLIKDASVHLNRKRLSYNMATQTYGPVRQKRAGIVKVDHKNAYYTFPVANDRYQPFFRKLALLPLRYIVWPIRRLTRKNHYYRNYFNGETAYEQAFKGFMVFSKPQYKPGDTVRLKVFVETNKGRLLKAPLILRLSDRSLDTDTILTTITPYRAGGYEYQFVLSDSLDLDLDKNYLVTLEEERSRKYNLDDYDGDLDDQEYALKRKVVIRGKFTYEDYELHSITFSARSNKTAHNRGEEAAFFLKAVDENEMAVMDGRVQILVTPETSGHEIFHAPRVFLPDTLWFHSQPLESLGETKINLPDSIFPGASFNYSVQCTFLNTNNERESKTLHQAFNGESRTISFELQKDSLKIDHRILGKDSPDSGTLYVFNEKEDTIEQRPIRMPAVIKVNPFATAYEVETDSLDESYELKPSKGIVSCLGSRTKDTVAVQLVNPYHLPVWYTVFAGNKIVLRGYGDTLVFLEKTSTPKDYFVSLQYIYHNQVHKENYTIPFQDKLLAIHADQPEFIYPGQTARINIHVTDSKGEAVPDADITAYGFTKKFQSVAPDIPYLGRRYPARKWYADLYLKEKEALEHTAGLNWERWSREMKLDTMEYYKFLHPQNMYINREPAIDSITQIAPFVVDKGDLQPVHLLYIDEVPVFFSQARQMQRYSFRISEGRHSIRLRTRNKLIRVDSVWIEKGMKNFISIDANTTNGKIHIEKAPGILTPHEKQLWSKYMIVVANNFGENLAYISQYPNLFLLNENSPGYKPSILTGPFTDNWARLIVKNKFEQGFELEGSWQYTISKGLIRQKQFRDPYLFSSWLPATTPVYNFHDFVLTEKEIDSLWQDYLDKRSSRTTLFANDYPGKTGTGKLRIGQDKANEGLFIKNIILFRYDNTDFIQVHPGITRDLGYLQPGKYRLFFLLKKDNYFIRDSITILQDGINYYETGRIIEKQRDGVSSRIARIIETRDKISSQEQTEEDLNRIKETFNEKYLQSAAFSETVSGTVSDDQGIPLPGVSIIIKGTRIGTITGANGQFSLGVPGNGTIVLQYIGYVPQELRINPNVSYNIVLTASENQLHEVVVAGYGLTTKRNMTGSVYSIAATGALAGRAPGLLIRGTNAITGNSAPLIIVDGLLYAGKLEDLDPSQISHTNVLKDAEATALFGDRAAGGVIIITTKKQATLSGPELPLPGNSLRRNFRDDAYWQPRLITDANGNTSFNTTFPDDITNWRTFVIAMTDKKQSGFLEGSIRSFKAISGNIALPLFAIAGDSIYAIGKTLNYLSDSIRVKRSFSVNDSLVKENFISLRNSWIDTFAVTVADKDSLKLQYTILKDNGYFDGEERSITVYQPGVLATTGFFAALNQDTTFRLQLPTDTATVKLYAETSLLPVLYEETESIRAYEYLCNEQLASKLKAMLTQKRIDQYLKRQFKGERNIRELINKLNQSRSTTGLWGWWTGNTPSLWISLHVMEALTDAQKSGYSININTVVLTDYLIYNQESYMDTEKLSSLYLLRQLGAKADFKRYIDSIEKRVKDMSLYERLRLTALKQELGVPVVLDTFITKQSHTVMGNAYWGEDNYRFFDNSIQNTLCMYRMLRKAGGYDDLLQRIRNYFLEKKKSGHWRNTYESSLILETILPDLLTEDALSKPASLTIQGKTTFTVKEFPFYTEIKSGEQLSVTKQGSMPVYFTAYQQHWNKTPESVAGNFMVHSFFERNNQPVSVLKAGTPAVLKVTVAVKADADYVLIEIPIPAGCSYQDKNQPGRNGEVHREYFKNKVSIFCKSLPKGEYQFSVSLLPRFTGTYTLNPAKAEMMYFPVFNGREAIRKVAIE